MKKIFAITLGAVLALSFLSLVSAEQIIGQLDLSDYSGGYSWSNSNGVTLGQGFNFSGGEYRISKVELFMSETGGSKCDYSITINPDVGGLPNFGTNLAINNTLFVGAQSYALRWKNISFANPPTLTPGTYWITISPCPAGAYGYVGVKVNDIEFIDFNNDTV